MEFSYLFPREPNETWLDTRKAVAKFLHKPLNMKYQDVFDMFERVHRGGGDGFQNQKKGKRDIYAKVTHWDDAEKIVKESNKFNKGKSKDQQVVVDYKYGTLTTLRRNEALKRRKELLQAKEYKNVFVKYPAKLMGRKSVNDDYDEIDDFSNHLVSKLPIHQFVES